MNEQNNDIFGNVVQPNVVPNASVGSNVNGENVVNQPSSEVAQGVNANGGVFINKPVNQETKLVEQTDNNGLNFEMPSSNTNTNVDLDKTAVLNPLEVSNDAGNNLLMSNNSFNTNINNNVNNNDEGANDNPFEFSVNPNITYDSSNTVGNNEDKKTEDNTNIVSVKKYLGHLLLFAIPIVGFIMLIVKAQDKKDKNISNLAKAQLILSAIVFVISFIVSIVVTTFIVGAVGSAVNTGSETINDSVYDYNYDNDYNFDF